MRAGDIRAVVLSSIEMIFVSSAPVAEQSAPPTVEPVSTSARWWVLVTIGIGTFMSALDGSVVNTLLPVLSRALGTSIAGIEWVTTIYLLVISGLLLSVGRAGDGHLLAQMRG